MVAGHLREMRGIYYIVLTYKDINGVKKQKAMSTGLSVKNNKRKAEEMLMDARRNFVAPDPNGADTLFTDYLNDWVETVRPYVESITFGSYPADQSKRHTRNSLLDE